MSSHIPLPKEKHSQTKLFVTLSALRSKKKEAQRCIETHPFNYRCTVISKTADLRQKVLEHIGPYYRVKLKPSDLISPDFIRGYIQTSAVVALSIDERIDTGDVLAIDGQGILVLSLCKDTYEVLGLVGEQAMFPLQPNARHIVRIDLKANIMDPTKKHYQRIKSRFEAVLDCEMEFVIGRYDRDTGKSLNLDIPGATVCEPAVDEFHMQDIWMPETSRLFDIQAGARKDDEWSQLATDVFEWIGMASSGPHRLLSAAGANTKIAAAAAAVVRDTCTYSVPEPRTRESFSSVSVSGLLSAGAIRRLADELGGDGSPNAADMILCVWGHEDAPVSWASSEHNFLISGENMYAQLRRPSCNQCVIFQACGPWDTFS
ncbi:hypothetical protein FB645_005717 [Coemansia sp. IMI 203386]|nr:hypothetical protein FB645_005717 [Coemansia sp. IMI 203386]